MADEKKDKAPSWLWWILASLTLIILITVYAVSGDNQKKPTSQNQAAQRPVVEKKQKWVLAWIDKSGKNKPCPTKAWVEVNNGSLLIRYLASNNPIKYGMFIGEKNPDGSYHGTWQDFKANGIFQAFFADKSTINGWLEGDKKIRYPFWVTKK